MNVDTFTSWLEAYKHAWEIRDPQAAAALFTSDATYQETPFREPMRGQAAILEYWSAVPQTQQDIRFSYAVLAVTQERGIARWRATYRKTSTHTQIQLDGIFVVTLNDERLCSTFEEWWHREENP